MPFVPSLTFFFHLHPTPPTSLPPTIMIRTLVRYFKNLKLYDYPRPPLGRWNQMHDVSSVHLKIDYANLDAGLGPNTALKKTDTKRTGGL